jgi:hypothetical protein
MNDRDALVADMHGPLGPPEAVPPIADQDILERLLEGRLDLRRPRRLRPAGQAAGGDDRPGRSRGMAGEQQAMATLATVLPSTPRPSPLGGPPCPGRR